MTGPGQLPVHVGLLGPVELRVKGEPQAPRSPLSRALLTLLAAARQVAIPADRLVDELVTAGLCDAMSRNTLQAHMSRLRDRLAPYGEHLTHGAGGYRLGGPCLGTDLDSVDGNVIAAREARAAGDVRAAARHGESALRAWRGLLGEDLPDLQGLFAIRARYQRLRLDLVEDMAGDRVVLGAGTDVAVAALDLDEQVRRDPLRERAWAYLMIAHARVGQQAEALSTFGRARTALADGAGLDPGPLLRQLQSAVLEHAGAEQLLVMAGLATAGHGVPALVWLDGSAASQHRWLQADTALTIGRHEHAAIRLLDSSVSRWHAAIRKEGADWVLLDLGSTNGTTVNGAATTRVALAPGDVIRCGDVGLLVTVKPRQAASTDGVDGPTDDLRGRP